MNYLEDMTDDVIEPAFAFLRQLHGDDEEGAASRQNFRARDLRQMFVSVT
jgi:hypothetical protein